MKINKRYVVVILIIALIIIGVPKSYANKKLDSIELRENNEINKKAFAMYVENGIGTYDVYSESEYFPNSLKYHYNGEMSKCIDNNEEEIVDNILEYNSEDNSVTVTSNRTVYCYLYFDLDEVKPGTPDAILSNVSNIDNKYTNTRNQTVTVTYSDEDIESYCISLNGTCDEYKTEGLNNVEKTITIKDFDLGDDGNKTVSVWLKDLAGNISDTPKTINIILDTKAPEIINLTVDGTTTYDSVIYVTNASPNVTITWSNDDVAKYCMSKANCEPETSITGNTLKVAVPLNDNAANTIHARVIDKAGNVSADKTYNLTVDTKISDISKVHIGGNATNNPTYVTVNNPTVYIEWSDSDIIKYCIVTSGTCTPSISVNAGAKSITTSAISLGADGNKTVNVVIQDRAGNTKSSSDSVIVDTTNPTYNLQKSGDYTNQIVINTNANDVTSGIQSVTCSATKGTCACTGTTNAVCTNSGLTGGVSSTITVTIKDKAGKSVTPNTTQTTKIDTAAGYIESKAPSGLNKTIQGGMWRYQGTQGNVNNYICFGTDTKATCTGDKDKYMYRIIGIVQDSTDTTVSKGMVKVIKQTPIKEGDIAEFNFDSNFTDTTIYERLNGTSDGSVSGTGGNTDIFIDNNLYSYMSSTNWTSKIVNKQWYQGDLNHAFMPTTVDAVFKQEHGIDAAKDYTGTAKKWQLTSDSFKVGLMTISDYEWSYLSSGINCYDRNNSATCKTSWIHLSNNNTTYFTEWTMSSVGRYTSSNRADYQYIIDDDGQLTTDRQFSSASLNAFRPVFYLIANTVIKSGTGSESDPFIIQV